MRLEHLFFNLAVAIIVGIAYQRMSGRDPSVIILLAAFLPDLDMAVHTGMHLLRRLLGTPVLVVHGSFHNILALAAISLLVAILASRYGIRFRTPPSARPSATAPTWSAIAWRSTRCLTSCGPWVPQERVRFPTPIPRIFFISHRGQCLRSRSRSSWLRHWCAPSSKGGAGSRTIPIRNVPDHRVSA